MYRFKFLHIHLLCFGVEKYPTVYEQDYENTDVTGYNCDSIIDCIYNLQSIFLLYIK